MIYLYIKYITEKWKMV